MEVAKLGLIFCIIVVIIWLKYPLYLAMTAGILSAILLFQIPVTEALLLLGRQTIAWETIDLLLSFYVIIFLQLMMEKKGRLKNARDSFDHLLRNRRLNTIVSPAIMGLLPSAAVMTICADMVDKTCEDYLDAKSKTFVSCFYRHIPEMFLPTFPVILLAMSLSGQNVGLFILSMIPLVILACLVVYFTYLRKIPREMPPVEGKVDTGRELMALVRNLWTLILVLAIIIVGNISATFAGAFVILLNYFVDHFRKSDLKDLIVARAEERLEKLIARSYPYVTDHEKISDCIDRIVDYAERSLPVLNDAGKLVGIITSSDVVELVDDEMGDDYAKLGGLTSEEDLNEGVFESVKKRLPWLIALLFLGMLVSSVVGAFESVVAVLPIVICFQSMVLDMAGNVGTQSLAVTIRVLVDENLTTAKKLQLLWKEMRVGLVNGALLAVMALGFLGCYIHFFKAYAWGEAFLLSGCVGVALIIAMVVSSLVGTVIPMLFHKIHIDPAVASGPLITTINDLVAIVVYYGLVAVVLIDMFHLA